MAANGKKRSSDDEIKSQSSKKWKPNFLNLRSSMENPELIVHKTESYVIIKDKYPKARLHFLVLVQDDIPTIASLKPCHVALLKRMHAAAEKLAAQHAQHKFRFGYHAVPSMSPLHLHAISQDFDSPSLRTKKHWNSFTTAYFIDSVALIEKLEEKDKITPLGSAVAESLLKTDLKCHICDYKPSTMPNLKKHIVKDHFPPHTS